MKNKILLALCVFALIGSIGLSVIMCNRKEVIIMDKYNNIELDRGEFCGIRKGANFLSYPASLIKNGQDAVKDEKLALEIGNAILKAYYGDEVVKNTEFRVSESGDRKLFKISRLENDSNIMGSSPSVVIRKKDGAIMMVGGD